MRRVLIRGEICVDWRWARIVVLGGRHSDVERDEARIWYVPSLSYSLTVKRNVSLLPITMMVVKVEEGLEGRGGGCRQLFYLGRN